MYTRRSFFPDLSVLVESSGLVGKLDYSFDYTDAWYPSSSLDPLIVHSGI